MNQFAAQMVDLVCINNYVVVDNETDKLKFAPLNNSVMLNVQKIKKIQKKCNIGSNLNLIKPHFLMLICSILISIIFIYIFYYYYYYYYYLKIFKIKYTFTLITYFILHV